MEILTSSSPWLSSLSNTSTTTTLNTTAGGDNWWSPRDVLALRAVYRYLDKAMPVTLTLGIVGNVLAVLAFMTSPLKFISLSHYLSALAVADVMNLLAGLVLWVSQHGWNLYTKVGFCQLTSFVLLMSRFLTVWYLLSAHVERLLVLYGQPNSKRWCSVFRTKCVILTVFVLSLVAFLHYIWSHVVVWKRGQYMCTTMQESVIHINRLRRVELVLALFLPMLLMVGIDAALVLKMIHKRLHAAVAKPPRSASDRMLTSLKAMGDHSLRSTDKDYASADNGEITALSKSQATEAVSIKEGTNGNRQKVTTGGGGGVGVGGGGGGGGGERGEQPVPIDLNKEKCRATVMCIVMGLGFIALTLPSAYLRARMSFAEQEGRFPLTTYEIHLMQVLEKVNQFTGLYKVLLYLLFLSSFRRALLALLRNVCLSRCCRCRRHRQFVTTV
ncbi:uncharacterized protein LOC143283564 [Babylonia areolata]|uniref:uncharacterized protein LOC143283564 n=1 Tax=Babylonia areolata TaxID=304850 RepID=UPI003FD1BAC0